ncbi:MAG: hypothetical protein AAGC68_12955, partial [Verrucomicrobiota bacterium]
GPSDREVERTLSFLNEQEKFGPSAPRTPDRFPGENGFRPVSQVFSKAAGIELGEKALWLQPGSRFERLELGEIAWPVDAFTIEAVAHLDNIHRDASVNTLVSRWNESKEMTGWTFGVTSEKSRYEPRNFILQLVGDDFQHNRIYEVVPSALRFPLRKPVYFAAAISARPNPDDVTKGSATFYLKDLSEPKSPVTRSTVPHQIVGGLNVASSLETFIGGRNGNRHLWDGQLARLRISTGILSEDELLVGSNQGKARVIAELQFKGEDGSRPNPFARWIEPAPKSDRSLIPSPALAAMTDFCQALLSSNEFLYLH